MDATLKDYAPAIVKALRCFVPDDDRGYRPKCAECPFRGSVTLSNGKKIYDCGKFEILEYAAQLIEKEIIAKTETEDD